MSKGVKTQHTMADIFTADKLHTAVLPNNQGLSVWTHRVESFVKAEMQIGSALHWETETKEKENKIDTK